MHVMPAHEYKNHWVTCNAGEIPGKFLDGFMISRHRQSTPVDQLGILFSRSLSIATAFATEAEAHKSATALAHEWIDAQGK